MISREDVTRVGTRVRHEFEQLRGDPDARTRLPARVKRKALAQWQSRPPILSRRRNDFPDAVIPRGPINRPNLRVAVLLDPFSTAAFFYEWDQEPVPREGWREHLERQPPHLLFVESAWTGNDGAWRLAMTGVEGPARDLVDLVAWCTERGIPTVFWNKEDPPNYGVFLATAALFDVVFTVDADRIPAYRSDLGHDRIHLLPFAAQPRIHNPVRRGTRPRGKVAFAGTYFAEKHPDRRAQMDILLRAAGPLGLDIFSRMQGTDKRYQFPAPFDRAVVGSLSYRQMLAAATSYRVFLNVNSVTASPTMCSRRLFELSAAQTAVLSTPAAAIEPYFGDTITVAGDVDHARTQLTLLLHQSEHRDRLALRAHRRVMATHRYTHRVSTVLEVVGLPDEAVSTPTISVIVPTIRPGQVDAVLRTVAAQTHPHTELILVPHGFEVDSEELGRQAREYGLANMVVVPAAASLTLGACMNLGVAAASGTYVAKMDDDNTYAPHYLADLVGAFDYTEATVVGKWAHYVHLAASDATVLRFASAEHRYVRLVQGGTIMTTRDAATSLLFEDLPRAVDTTFLDKVRRAGGSVYSADRFNFVSRRASTPAGHTWGITDAELLTRSSELVFYGDPVHHVTV